MEGSNWGGSQPAAGGAMQGPMQERAANYAGRSLLAEHGVLKDAAPTIGNARRAEGQIGACIDILAGLMVENTKLTHQLKARLEPVLRLEPEAAEKANGQSVAPELQPFLQTQAGARLVDVAMMQMRNLEMLRELHRQLAL